MYTGTSSNWLYENFYEQSLLSAQIQLRLAYEELTSWVTEPDRKEYTERKYKKACEQVEYWKNAIAKYK